MPTADPDWPTVITKNDALSRRRQNPGKKEEACVLNHARKGLEREEEGRKKAVENVKWVHQLVVRRPLRPN